MTQRVSVVPWFPIHRASNAPTAPSDSRRDQPGHRSPAPPAEGFASHGAALFFPQPVAFSAQGVDFGQPDGQRLVTLQDAGTYITKLPKAEHEAPEWRAAMECLILVAEKNAPTMMARIGVMRGTQSPRRAGVRPVAQGKALGQAEVEAGPMINRTGASSANLSQMARNRQFDSDWSPVSALRNLS
jgi:hypothetical protein